MRDSKLLLPLSLFFLLLSFALVTFWGYRFYYEKPAVEKNASNGSKPSDAYTKNTSGRDSLLTVYNSTINGMDHRLDSTLTNATSLKNELDGKLSEFQKLKQEIVTLLKDPGNQADLNMAKTKIAELQQRVDDLKMRNTDVVVENKRLSELVDQLKNEKQEPELTVKHTSPNIIVPSENVVPAPTFVVSDLRLAAVKGENDQETNQSQAAEKLVGSFVVKNNLIQFSSSEMMVIVTQPDGHVLQSDWESGSFDTKQGKRTYSCKLKFDYSKGEGKRLQFSLSSDSFQKGEYTMQVYHNGSIVGKYTKRLS